MTKEQLSEVLDKHAKWLIGEQGGERANLSGANLECADLYGANLQDANLCGAYLECANLRGANLSGANLECADLRDANLQSANLQDANLSGTLLADKPVVRFAIGTKHQAILIGDELQIGCHKKRLSEWAESFVKIGEDNGYTEKDIRAYGIMIKALQELSHEEGR